MAARRVVACICSVCLVLMVSAAAANAAAPVTQKAAEKPPPATEIRLRKTIDDIRRGAPDYSEMVPELSAAVRKDFGSIRAKLLPLGAVKSIAFVGMHRSVPVYEVAFEKGAQVWAIYVTPEGRTTALFFE